jgi:hypothetical protein
MQGWLFEGFFGEEKLPRTVTTIDLIRPILAAPARPFGPLRTFRAWRSDGSSPVYQIDGMGFRFQYLRHLALAIGFQATALETPQK